MKIKKLLLGIILLSLSLILMACSDDDAETAGKREPISINKISWDKLLSNSNWSGIERISFDNGTQKNVLYSYDFDSIKLAVSIFKNNQDKIYSVNRDNTIKVHIKFYHTGFFDESRSKSIYDNKQCTFYIDNSYIENNDGKREEMSVKAINWYKVETYHNYNEIEHIIVYGEKGKTYKLSPSLDKVDVLLKNKEKLKTNPYKNSYKIHLKFKWGNLFDLSNDKTPYNGTQCTFYVDSAVKDQLIAAK